uniref:Uncharacterized protein n=1 Tax=Anopheles minimus TaxID=112268 RepID=A0A182WQD4_9DIPT
MRFWSLCTSKGSCSIPCPCANRKLKSRVVRCEVLWKLIPCAGQILWT